MTGKTRKVLNALTQHEFECAVDSEHPKQSLIQMIVKSSDVDSKVGALGSAVAQLKICQRDLVESQTETGILRRRIHLLQQEYEKQVALLVLSFVSLLLVSCCGCRRKKTFLKLMTTLPVIPLT